MQNHRFNPVICSMRDFHRMCGRNQKHKMLQCNQWCQRIPDIQRLCEFWTRRKQCSCKQHWGHQVSTSDTVLSFDTWFKIWLLYYPALGWLYYNHFIFYVHVLPQRHTMSWLVKYLFFCICDWEVSNQINYGCITGNLAEFAGCQHSKLIWFQF